MSAQGGSKKDLLFTIRNLQAEVSRLSELNEANIKTLAHEIMKMIAINVSWNQEVTEDEILDCIKNQLWKEENEDHQENR